MRSLRPFLLAVVAAGTLATAPAGAQASRTAAGTGTPASTAVTYVIDPVHSELSFRIRHLLGRVAGTFGEWQGTVVMDSVTPANSRVEVVVKTASIDTRVAPRNEHLRSNDFFAADSFPTITFTSRNVVMNGDKLRVLGDLTIRGRTRPVVLLGRFAGRFQDPWGKMRTAFFATTTIDRNDFGVSFNGPFQEIGQIGNEVAIEIAIEAVQQ